MPRIPLGRTLAAVVVSLTLATPWCAAAALKSPSPAQAARPTASTLQDVAHHLWGWLTERWTKVGCSIDPGGLFACSSAPTGALKHEGEVGCSIDPSGTLSCGM